MQLEFVEYFAARYQDLTSPLRGLGRFLERSAIFSRCQQRHGFITEAVPCRNESARPRHASRLLKVLACSEV